MPKKGRICIDNIVFHYAESHIQGRRDHMEDRVVCKKLKIGFVIFFCFFCFVLFFLLFFFLYF